MSWVKVSGFFIPVSRPLASVLGFPGLFHVLGLVSEAICERFRFSEAIRRCFRFSQPL